jgi:hypothetical protein
MYAYDPAGGAPKANGAKVGAAPDVIGRADEGGTDRHVFIRAAEEL